MHVLYVKLPWWWLFFGYSPFSWCFQTISSLDVCMKRAEDMKKEGFLTKIIFTDGPVEWEIPSRLLFWKKQYFK